MILLQANEIDGVYEVLSFDCEESAIMDGVDFYKSLFSCTTTIGSAISDKNLIEKIESEYGIKRIAP